MYNHEHTNSRSVSYMDNCNGRRRRDTHHIELLSRSPFESDILNMLRRDQEQKSKQHTKESCAGRNRRGWLKPWLRTTSKSSSIQHYNGNARKPNCLKRSLRRFLLPRANHSVLLECLNSTVLRDAAVTGLAEIALHPDIIWQMVRYTPDSAHKSSWSARRWYRTMTQYVKIANKEVAAVQEKDWWWRVQKSFALKYQS